METMKEIMDGIYGVPNFQEETELEKKEREAQETEEVLQMLHAIGESAKK